jgi:hypothetical protein
MSKNMQKVQDMVDGNYKNKTQIGYGDQETKHRSVGDKWTDSDGYDWEQCDGYQVKSGGSMATRGIADNCSGCEKFISKPWDKDTYKADGRCYHCQLNYELDLKFEAPIRWFAYRRLKDFQNMKSIEKELLQWIDENEKMLKENPFDKRVANALANGEVELTINKNKTMN